LLRPQAVLSLEQGMIQEALGHPDSAIVAYNTAWALDSTSAEAGFHLSRVYLPMGGPLRGMAWVSPGQAPGPGHYPTAFLAARAFAAQHNKELSDRALARARRLHPSTFGGLTDIKPAGADSLMQAAERDLLAGDLTAAVNRSYAATVDRTRRGRAL